MKLTDKRLWILVIVIASAAVASAQAVFSVEEISYVEYANAEKECSRYNVIPTGTITDNEIVNMVLKESQTKFERLDSFTRRDIYDFVEGFGINKQWLLYFPKFKLYGFVIPNTPFEDSVWWFDAESGRYLCEAAFPTAININGMYVSQTGYDCDGPLDLKFFRREENYIYNFQSYKNTQYNEFVFQEDFKIQPIFWHDNNMLFLKTYDHKRQKEVYLKIKVEQSVGNCEKGGSDETDR